MIKGSQQRYINNNLSNNKQFVFSLYAGICASFGSIFGKLSNVQISFIDNYAIQCFTSTSFILLMITCNAAVWTFYVKALQETNSSLVPTLCVAAINYILSAVVGSLVFGEPLSLLWSVGTAFILTGLALLASDNHHIDREKRL